MIFCGAFLLSGLLNVSLPQLKLCHSVYNKHITVKCEFYFREYRKTLNVKLCVKNYVKMENLIFFENIIFLAKMENIIFFLKISSFLKFAIDCPIKLCNSQIMPGNPAGSKRRKTMQKTTFTIQAIPAQYYNSGGHTMISVAYGAPFIIRAVHDDYKTLKQAFDTAYDQAIASGANCFTLRTAVNGRKPRGYDASASQFRRDYVAPDAIPYM